MKKTILLLLTSVSCVLMSACYTTPEMDENKYRLSYEEGEIGCNTQADYQHEGLRECIEKRMAYEDAHKKTVTIIPTENGTLVIPKAQGDVDMMDTSRVYEVVGGESVNVVVEDGTSPDSALTQTTVTIEAVEKDNTDETVDEAVVEGNQETIEGELVAFEEVDENGALTEKTDEVIDAVEEDQEPEEFAATAQSLATETSVNASEGANGQTVTLVVGPLKEDLVVSVKSTPAVQTEVSTEKKEEKKVIQKEKTVVTYKKSEKEVLPTEEK